MAMLLILVLLILMTDSTIDHDDDGVANTLDDDDDDDTATTIKLIMCFCPDEYIDDRLIMIIGLLLSRMRFVACVLRK